MQLSAADPGTLTSLYFLGFALLAREFRRELLGRIAAAANLLMFASIFLCQVGTGAIIDMWPHEGGTYPPQAHAVSGQEGG